MAAAAPERFANWQVHYGALELWPVPSDVWLECQLSYREARALVGLPLDPEFRLHVLRGRGYAALRRPLEALEEFELAKRFAPEDKQLQLEMHRVRALWLVHCREYSAAASEYQLAADLAPDDAGQKLPERHGPR